LPDFPLISGVDNDTAHLNKKTLMFDMNALLADAAGVTQPVARSAKTLDNFPLIPQNQKIDWTSAASYILISALILNMSITHIQSKTTFCLIRAMSCCLMERVFPESCTPPAPTKRSPVAEKLSRENPDAAIEE
jgi:hypothetical protein